MPLWRKFIGTDTGGSGGGGTGDAGSEIAVIRGWRAREAALVTPAGGINYPSGLVHNGKLWLVGGGEAADASVTVYDPALDSFTAKASLPAPRRYHSGAVVGDFIYIFGGVGGTNAAQHEAWRYDIVGNTWAPIAPKPTSTSIITYATAVGTDIYILTGADVVNFYRYDTVGDTYTPLTAPPAAYTGGFVHISGKLYFAGATAGGASQATYEYDLAGDGSWTTRTAPPAAVGSGSQVNAGVVHNGELWLIGGAASAKVASYNPATDVWTTRADWVFSGVYHPALGSIGGTLIAVGEYALTVHASSLDSVKYDIDLAQLGDIGPDAVGYPVDSTSRFLAKRSDGTGWESRAIPDIPYRQIGNTAYGMIWSVNGAVDFTSTQNAADRTMIDFPATDASIEGHPVFDITHPTRNPAPNNWGPIVKENGLYTIVIESYLERVDAAMDAAVKASGNLHWMFMNPGMTMPLHMIEAAPRSDHPADRRLYHPGITGFLYGQDPATTNNATLTLTVDTTATGLVTGSYRVWYTVHFAKLL